jgi:branched-chain amino acid transport system permease protein
MIIGSALAGLAGVLYASYSGYINADDFVPQRTFDIWTMVIIGGVANNRGALFGALLMSVMDSSISAVSIQLSMLALPIQINYVRDVILATVVILVLVNRPKGVIPEKPVNTPAWDVLK